MPVHALVGRDRELEVLLGGLEDLGGGRGRLFLLSGEPGIGKTRLADELCQRATERSARVAWGAAWDGGGAPAYWPWIQALRALRTYFGEPDARLRRDLGPLWDGDAREEDESDPEVVRFRRFDALRAVLASASTRAPLVLVLDDLHAADRGSLLALSFLARALRECPVLVVGTHRDAEVRLNAMAGEILARVAREGTTIPLRRLDQPEVADLMAHLEHVTPQLVADVYGTSGGNPLFVEEILRWVRMGGHAREVPDGVRAIIDERIGRLDEPARALLGLLAVLGRESDWATLGRVANAEPATLRARLQTASRAGVVTLGPTDVRFAHALFRESLYASLEPARAREAHLRAAAAFSRDAAESIALHRIAALPAGDAKETAEASMLAAKLAEKAHAFDRATTLYEGALKALDLAPPAPAKRVDAMLGLADALGRAGATERGGAMCLAAAEAARAMGDGARLSAAALAYGAQFRIGLVDPILVGLLEEGLAAMDPSDRPLRARVMARLAAAEQPAPDPQQPIQRAREAIALAREVGDPETLLTTLFTAGSALVDYAPPAERARVNQEIVALALARGELAIAQHAYVRLAIDACELGDIAGADDAIAANERLGRALGHPRWRWRGHLLHSMRALMDGRWHDSEAAIAEATRLAQQTDDAATALGTTIALHRLGAVWAREAASLADADALWTPAIDRLGFASSWTPPLRAAIGQRLGGLDAPKMRAIAPGEEAMQSDPMYLSLISEVLAESDQRELAEALLPHVEVFPADYVTWGVFAVIWAGPRSRMIASVLRALGKWDEAATLLEDALESVDAIGARPLAARVRLELAMTLSHRAGSRARLLLDEAREMATELGMTHLLARIRSVEVAPAPRASEAIAMTREGEIWHVTLGAHTAQLRHSRALDILAQLVASPGRELHVLDLAAGADPRDVIDVGDAGPMLDEQAKASYERRLADLDAELAEAEDWADNARRERLRAEAELLREEIARAVGASGRDRRAARAEERARVNVQKRLRGAIQRIGEQAPALGRHLQDRINTGLYVSYRL